MSATVEDWFTVKPYLATQDTKCPTPWEFSPVFWEGRQAGKFRVNALLESGSGPKEDGITSPIHLSFV